MCQNHVKKASRLRGMLAVTMAQGDDSAFGLGIGKLAVDRARLLLAGPRHGWQQRHAVTQRYQCLNRRDLGSAADDAGLDLVAPAEADHLLAQAMHLVDQDERLLA
jgi:hypothetical protein